jgi:RNA polymerase sigma-70 factor (ECF subfamily)
MRSYSVIAAIELELGAERPEAAEEFTRELLAASAGAFRLARQLGRSPEEAADVVQDAAILAWRYRRTLRGLFRPWFLRIVHRVASRPRLSWVTVPVFFRAPKTSVTASALDPELAAALNRIPRRQRVALWLRYGEDMNTEDGASVMRLKPTAFKQLVARGRESLRRELGDSSEEAGL